MQRKKGHKGVEKVIKGVKKVTIKGGASVNRFSIMEARLKDDVDRFCGTKYLSCDSLKEKGVIKRANSFQKAERWLNTEEGLAWVETAKHHQIF